MPWRKTEQGIPYFEEPVQTSVPLNDKGEIVSPSAPPHTVHMGKLSLEQIEAIDKMRSVKIKSTDPHPGSNYHPKYGVNGRRLRAGRIG